MSRIDAAISRFADQIETLTARLGKRVVIDLRTVADRSGMLALQPPGIWSANGCCRLVRVANGWIAANLPRRSDRWLVPAWVGCGLDDDIWEAIVDRVADRPWQEVVTDARRLGLPVAAVGEVVPGQIDTMLTRFGPDHQHRRPPNRPFRVIDLSTMWAGPLCGSILAQMGATVVKVESRSRPDMTRITSPLFDARLNGLKARVDLDFAHPPDIAWLHQAIASADIVITSARIRAFEQLGLAPTELFRENPFLVWVAISGHGWMGDNADRVAFGDDAAAAGGLLRWSAQGVPQFISDAVADPLGGLGAAVGALRALDGGGGYLVDASLSEIAADVALHQLPRLRA